MVATMEAAGPASPVAEVSPAPGRATAVGITPGAVAPGGPVPYVAVPAGAARPAAAETSASAPRVDAPAQPAIAAQATSATSPPAPSPAVNAGAAAAAGPPVNATPARPIQKVNPVLPVEFSGRRADPVSEVQIEVLIDPKGKVWSERVLNSSKVFNHALINSAMAAAKKWQFEPARQNGTPVYSQMILKFQFGTARP